MGQRPQERLAEPRFRGRGAGWEEAGRKWTAAAGTWRGVGPKEGGRKKKEGSRLDAPALSFLRLPPHHTPAHQHQHQRADHAFFYFTTQYNTIHCIALHRIALHYITLHYIYITLHQTTPQSLHCTAPHRLTSFTLFRSRGGYHVPLRHHRLPAQAGRGRERGGGNANEYYAGGAGPQGGSGISVVGGNGGDPSNNDAVRQIIERARRGAEEGAGDGQRPMRTVTFYRDGFTVDDGPLRQPGEPANDAFLRSISNGMCPTELIDPETRMPADVNLVDKRGEEYSASAPAAPAYVAFSGEGQTLGASAGAAAGGAPGAIVVPGVETKGATPPGEIPAGEPSVRVQIRFPDNSRQVAKFRPKHTVRNLIAFVEAAGKVSGAYQLLSASSTGAPRPLDASVFDQTIKDAGLAGTSVTVKEL